MRSRIEINSKQLIDNLNIFKRLIDGRKLLFAVKGNAYGHGIKEVVSILKEYDLVDYYGVDSLTEALIVKETDPKKKILILGWCDRDELKNVLENGFEIVAPSVDFLDMINEVSQNEGKTGVVHMKLETGTSRLGMNPEEFIGVMKKFPYKNIRVAGVYSHYANIEDTTDHSFALSQRKIFEDVLSGFNLRGVLKHFSCSAAALLFPETYFDMVRVGISGYGMWPSKQTLLSYLESGRNNIELKPVLSWYSKVAQIKNIKKGSPVSYGLTYKAFNDMKIAVIPVGYYDGYDRKLSNISTVMIKGNKAPVRGRVCMNMFMVDVSHIKGVKQGDEVILIGNDNNEKITAEELGELAGTINYEIISRIGPHIPRIIA